MPDILDQVSSLLTSPTELILLSNAVVPVLAVVISVVTVESSLVVSVPVLVSVTVPVWSKVFVPVCLLEPDAVLYDVDDKLLVLDVVSLEVLVSLLLLLVS